jgi:hypothetical protein
MGRHPGLEAVLLQTAHLGVDVSWEVGDSELGQLEFQGEKTQSDMGVRHHAIPDRIWVVVFGGGDGPLFETDHRVVNEDDPTGGTGD